MPEFETFSRGLLALKREPCVTIMRRGIMSLNKSAYVAMGSPAAVELLYDTQARTVGLRPIDIHADAAQYVRGAGKGTAGPFLISAMAFTKFYDIDLTTSRRWIAYLEDGILCVNLGDTATAVANLRARDRPVLRSRDQAYGRDVGRQLDQA